METFSLINVSKEHDGNLISGSILINHVGSLQSAKQLVEKINKVNSYLLNIAIVKQVNTTTNFNVYKIKKII